MQRIGWKGLVLCSLLCFIVAAQAIAQEKNDFQKGKVLSVKKMSTSNSTNAASEPTGASDAPLANRQYGYTVAVQAGDTIYDLGVQAMTPDLQQLLVEGQTVDIKPGKKTAQIRNSLGHVMEFSVTGKHSAS